MLDASNTIYQMAESNTLVFTRKHRHFFFLPYPEGKLVAQGMLKQSMSRNNNLQIKMKLIYEIQYMSHVV